MAAIIPIRQYESKDVIPLAERTPGVYDQLVSVFGNSILSTVFLSTLDSGASLLVEYFGYTTGFDEGELFLVQTHDLLDAANSNDQVLVSNNHDKVLVRCTVAGGNARFSVYDTIVQTSASDIDRALKRDGQTVDIDIDKGMPKAIYDEAAGEWRFARGTGGVQDVAIVGDITIDEPGDPLFLDAAAATTPGSEQTLISYSVPSGFKVFLYRATVICRQQASFKVFRDASVIGSGRTGASAMNVSFAYRVPRIIMAGETLEIKATVLSGNPSSDIECYVQATLSPI